MAGMVACKFFARGTCRYGESCKFYHDRGGASGSFNYAANNYNNSILSPSNFRPQGQNQPQHQQQQNFRQVGFSNKTMETLTQLEEATIKDMKEWEFSQMWPLSVYAPVSQKACLPGFEDYSPEELRYSWLQHGRQPPPDLMARIQRVNDLRSAYQKSGNTRAVLDRLIKGATTEQIAAEFNLPTSSTMAGTNWGTPVANPIATPGFNMMNQTPKLQVGLQNNPLNLGNNSSLGGGLWGQPQPNLPAPSFTGQSNVNSIFAPAMNTIIGDTMDASELSAAMAQQSQQSNNQMLNPGFGNFQPQSNQLPPEKKFSFQLDNNSGGTNVNPNPTIGSAPPFGINFTGAQQSAPNIFGGSTLPQNVSVNPINNQASQQIQPSVGNFVYSEEADLTEEDKASFMADKFNVVPLKPPARSYCL